MFRLYRPPAELVFHPAFGLLRSFPRARPGFLPVLFPVESPAKMLPALAAATKFIALVLAVCRVANEDRNDWRCAHTAKNGSTKLAQIAVSKRKPRCLCGVLAPVNCWDWTKAIALPRVPETRPVVPISAGAILGSGARCPRPQSPHVPYNLVIQSSSAGSSSFPV